MSGVFLCRLIHMMRRLSMMTLRHVRVMTGLFVFALVMRLSSRTMMLRRLFVMFRRLRMVFLRWMTCRHDFYSFVNKTLFGTLPALIFYVKQLR
jgi:hypothetical protein